MGFRHDEEKDVWVGESEGSGVDAHWEGEPERRDWVQALMARRKQTDGRARMGDDQAGVWISSVEFLGLEKVQTQWYLVCLAFNLRKLCGCS